MNKSSAERQSFFDTKGNKDMESLIARIEDENAEVCNKTGLYLTLAQECIERGEVELGKAYLVALCRATSNYEESIAFNELTAVWEKYKHLVEGLVPPPVSVYGPETLLPEDCSMAIGDILNGPVENVLTDLSAHVGELSGNGSSLGNLNKWERAFFYADEVCMEVNSGGFEGYLYYHGTHFSRAFQAFAQIGALQMVSLMEQIQRKFPRGRVPKSEEAIQNAMDKLEGRGVDFEDEDDIYYTTAEKELLDRLTAYVMEYRKHFR